MINPADESLLRRAIGIAAHAVTLGEAPYGSLLAGPDGAIVAEAHNTARRLPVGPLRPPLLTSNLSI